MDERVPIWFGAEMSLFFRSRVRVRARKFGLLNTGVAALWVVLLLVICVRVEIKPEKNSVVGTYAAGGRRWLESKPLYSGSRGFVYSPATAALFVPCAVMPAVAGGILWRLLNAGVLLGGVAWWLREGFYRGIPRRLYWLVFLLLLPLSIGNLNNGQVNPLLIGLLMIGIAACHREHWMLAAFCIAVATYFKIYPLAVGLLLALVYPRQFTWRLAFALLAIGALSFVLQKPSYVLEQYRLWVQTRLADNRQLYGNDIAPRDLWMLFRLAHVSIGEPAYRVLQLLSGAAIGGLCWVGGPGLKNWPEERRLVALFSLVCCWMLLCGPATESATYIMLAPAVVLALVQAFARPLPLWMRGWVVAAFAILLLALGINSFLKLHKTVAVMSVQPLAALVFCGYGVVAIRKVFWTGEGCDTASLIRPTP